MEKEYIKAGQKVRIVYNPSNKSTIGKVGVVEAVRKVHNKLGYLYRVSIDGKVLRGYATRADIEPV